MAKKRILFMMPALPGGGAEKVLIDILKNFDYTKYDVTLFLEYRQGIYLDDIPSQVELLHLHKENNLWFQRLHRRLSERGWYAKFHELFYRPMLLRLLKGRYFDTIISFMEGAAVKFHSYIIDKADKNVSWVHIDFKKKHWSIAFFNDKEDEHAAYKKMDNVVFVSEDAKCSFEEMYTLPQDSAKVIYNMIDCDEIRRLAQITDIQKEKFTICMVGRLNQQKRYDRAIEVAKKLVDSGYDFELWILGEGELESDLHKQVATYALENVVLFKGFIKPAYSYIKQADIFLNTSESEGYPLTMCEALCLGRPIVATNITGAREILDNSKYGLLVDETVDSIYQGIKMLIDNVDVREKYANISYKQSQAFSVGETMNQVYSL